MSKQMVIEENGRFYPVTKGRFFYSYFYTDFSQPDGLSGSEAISFTTKEAAIEFFNKPKTKVVWQEDN